MASHGEHQHEVLLQDQKDAEDGGYEGPGPARLPVVYGEAADASLIVDVLDRCTYQSLLQFVLIHIEVPDSYGDPPFGNVHQAVLPRKPRLTREHIEPPPAERDHDLLLGIGMHEGHVRVGEEANPNHDVPELVGVGGKALSGHVLLDEPHALLLGVGHYVGAPQPVDQEPQVLWKWSELFLNPFFLLVVVMPELLASARNYLLPVVLLQLLGEFLLLVLREEVVQEKQAGQFRVLLHR